MAIFQLAAAGKLAVTDTIAKHLPKYPNQEIAGKVTVAQLLNQTSGLGDVFGPRFAQLSRLRLRSISDYIPLYANDPLLFEPGTSRKYSNYGYIVLGAIIEAVSGETYPDYVKRHIFDPAGMTHSGFFESDRIVSDLAIGHTHLGPGSDEPGAELRENTLILPVRGTADGGSHSTARDLFLFDRSLRKGRLLDASAVSRIIGDNGSQANGVILGQAAWAGGAPGLNAMAISDGHWCVIVLSNFDPPIAESLGEGVLFPAIKKSSTLLTERRNAPGATAVF